MTLHNQANAPRKTSLLTVEGNSPGFPQWASVSLEKALTQWIIEPNTDVLREF